MVTWFESHRRSEKLASAAHTSLRIGDESSAQQLFAEAAIAEEEALRHISTDRPTTLGVIALSASALWLNAKRVDDAARVARLFLRIPALLPLAQKHLEGLNVDSIARRELREPVG